MELERETGWELHPIGGDTGHAYMGTKNEERLFLKRNSSPFLAALSLEGISPKLVWTKRIGNGDVLTAQEWCSGRTLHRSEMSSVNVQRIIDKVHQSESLKRMLHRLGGKVFSPSDFYFECLYDMAPELAAHPLIQQAFSFLDRYMPEDAPLENKVVCHGDVSHKNFLLSNEEHLFLVDWDSALLADPFADLGQLLVRYFEVAEWDNWIHANYGTFSDSVHDKLFWYSVVNSVLDIKSNHKKQDFIRMNHNLLKLNGVLSFV
ncbi:MAG: phosphotransferase family protein [Alkalibacterium sp.]|nr:phosphotransferase family protein [Alkalibacterium sp.]TVP92327.1 MAG: phosphotransferase [Alkalibacterium sp.]